MVGLLLASSCTSQRRSRIDPLELSHSDEYYKAKLREVAVTRRIMPDANGPSVATSPAPRTVRDRTEDTPWELSLTEAVYAALRNNPIVRQNAQFLSPGNPLLTQTEQASSIFDLAIQSNEVQFGQRGIEAALSDFNPQFTSSMIWGKNETGQNNQFVVLDPTRPVLQEDIGNFDSRIEQNLPTGGSVALAHNWDYSQTNQQNRLFTSAYTGLLQAELRQPLWAGAGPSFTSIAGPVSNSNRQTRLNQGVRLAQVNQKISTIDFELAVNNLVKDVNDAYWQLFQAYGEYGAELAVRDTAEQVWKEVAANPKAQGAAVEAQAESTYLESRARTETALAQLYENETRLRRMMGLPVNDGRVLKPQPLPVTDEIIPDWESAIGDAYSLRRELRRQKYLIQSLEWQLFAAKSLTNPRLDLVANYRLNGFGDKLISRQRNDNSTSEGFNSAYGSLLASRQSGWDMGVQFSMPIGFQAEKAQVRSLELRLAKARVALEQQEREIQHEMSIAVQAVARWYQLLKTNNERKVAAQKQVDALDAEYRSGRAERSTVDLLLRARLSLAQALIESTRSTVSYNIALNDVDYRKGLLLDRYNVHVETQLAQK